MEWIGTVQGILTLITAFVGLCGTIIGAVFTIKGYLKAAKEKSFKENWDTIMAFADAAMLEAEKSGKEGKAKKDIAINSVKAGCIAAGLDITPFLDQLSAYIDTCIEFANGIKK